MIGWKKIKILSSFPSKPCLTDDAHTVAINFMRDLRLGYSFGHNQLHHYFSCSAINLLPAILHQSRILLEEKKHISEMSSDCNRWSREEIAISFYFLSRQISPAALCHLLQWRGYFR